MSRDGSPRDSAVRAAGFQELGGRLLDQLRGRIGRGELSGRSLARLLRCSQPHVHNVLHGRRSLTPEFADRLLRVLGIPLLSLLTQEELGGLAPPGAVDFVPTPLLAGRLGAGNPFPHLGGEAERYFLPAAALKTAVNPAVARLAANETAMQPMLEPGDWVLLDRSPAVRRRPRFEHVYALSWKAAGFVARCRVVSGALVLVGDNPVQSGEVPSQIPLAEHDILEVVQGKIAWVGREL